MVVSCFFVVFFVQFLLHSVLCRFEASRLKKGKVFEKTKHSYRCSFLHKAFPTFIFENKNSKHTYLYQYNGKVRVLFFFSWLIWGLTWFCCLLGAGPFQKTDFFLIRLNLMHGMTITTKKMVTIITMTTFSLMRIDMIIYIDTVMILISKADKQQQQQQQSNDNNQVACVTEFDQIPTFFKLRTVTTTITVMALQPMMETVSWRKKMMGSQWFPGLEKGVKALHRRKAV